MSQIEQMSTSEALSYIGISRSTLKRYEKQGAIKPVSREGQTDLYATADLNRLRDKATKNDIPGKGKGRAQFAQAGKQAGVEFEQRLAGVIEKLDASSTQGLSEHQSRKLKLQVQEVLRASIANALVELKAVEIIAADLENPAPNVRHSAFDKLMKYVMPTMQSVSVEKIGGDKNTRQDQLMVEAMRKIKAIEDKQKEQQLLTGPVRVLEGEIVE